jgi:hypothetical protein
MTAVRTKVLVIYLPPRKVTGNYSNHSEVILIISIVTALLISFFGGKCFYVG